MKIGCFNFHPLAALAQRVAPQDEFVFFFILSEMDPRLRGDDGTLLFANLLPNCPLNIVA